MKTSNVNFWAFNESGGALIENGGVKVPTIEWTKNYLKNVFGGGYHSDFNNISSHGIMKSRGVNFNFKPHLKRILVKQHGSWQEYYTISKTALQKCIGKIDEYVYINH